MLEKFINDDCQESEENKKELFGDDVDPIQKEIIPIFISPTDNINVSDVSGVVIFRNNENKIIFAHATPKLSSESIVCMSGYVEDDTFISFFDSYNNIVVTVNKLVNDEEIKWMPCRLPINIAPRRELIDWVCILRDTNNNIVYACPYPVTDTNVLYYRGYIELDDCIMLFDKTGKQVDVIHKKSKNTSDKTDTVAHQDDIMKEGSYVKHTSEPGRIHGSLDNEHAEENSNEFIRKPLINILRCTYNGTRNPFVRIGVLRILKVYFNVKFK